MIGWLIIWLILFSDGWMAGLIDWLIGELKIESSLLRIYSTVHAMITIWCAIYLLFLIYINDDYTYVFYMNIHIYIYILISNLFLLLTLIAPYFTVNGSNFTIAGTYLLISFQSIIIISSSVTHASCSVYTLHHQCTVYLWKGYSTH